MFLCSSCLRWSNGNQGRRRHTLRPLFPKSSPLSSDFSFYASLETFSARLTVSRGLILVILARLLANELQKQAKERIEPRKPRETKPFWGWSRSKMFYCYCFMACSRERAAEFKEEFCNQLQATANWRRVQAVGRDPPPRAKINRSRYHFPLLSVLRSSFQKKACSVCSKSLNSMSPRHH